MVQDTTFLDKEWRLYWEDPREELCLRTNSITKLHFLLTPKISSCFSNDAKADALDHTVQLTWHVTGIFQMTLTTRGLFSRAPASLIFRAFSNITGEISSSLDILLIVATKLINWGERYLTVDKPLDLCPLSFKFRHSFCKPFSLPYRSVSLPLLFTTLRWHLFASSGSSCLSFAKPGASLLPVPIWQDTTSHCCCAYSTLPSPEAFLPCWGSCLLHPLELVPNRALLGVTVVA